MSPTSTDRIERQILLRAPRSRVWPGYEHVAFDIAIERMEPERLFSWRWHPHPVEPGVDYSAEPTTLVVFELRRWPAGPCSPWSSPASTRFPWRAVPRRIG